ncbi:dipeptidyl peptidase 4-like isoform 1-T1 [Synchiropus picturatus]
MQVSIAKVALGVLGVTVVCVLIAVPTAIFLSDKDGSVSDIRTFTLEDVFNSSMKPQSFGMRWISDHQYLRKQNGSVYIMDVISGASTEVLSQDIITERQVYDYQLSADQKYFALISNYTKVWRHSFTATYVLYDRLSKKYLPLADNPHQVQYFSWAPTGNRLAFVWKNNVYVKSSPESPAQQVTFDGRENQILNGIPDWVYEEEMFSSSQGFWWSPGGKYVAYAQFNDTEVPNIEYSWYGEDQYPTTVSIPYPKAGATNPVAKLFVVNAENTTDVTEVLVPEKFRDVDHYLATVTWAADDRLAVQWLKRLQNHLILQIYSRTDSGWDPAEKQEISSSTGWIGRFSPPEPVFAPHNTSYYYLLMSDSEGFFHIHHVVEGVATPLTSGKWEVIAIQSVTEDSVYFSSNEAGGKPGGRNVYKWTKQGVTCLTCGSGGEDCQYNSAYFSHSASFYRMSCSGPGVPFHTLVNNSNGEVMQHVENNSEFKLAVTDVHMPTMRRGTIKVAGYDLWYQMFLPPGFSESKKYPLLIDVYAGPCSQKVDFQYRVSWATYLASTEKVIVASFDGRGSGYQGNEIMHKIYKRLGTYEVEDQITAAKEFIKMGFIDSDRVAIWGWSYGGYVTSMALGSASKVYKCGMAVAPVSKWDYYDSIYTERYMTEPKDNPGFYANTTVTALAKNFHSVQYLLVHGTADDNVHFQQAAEISEALVEEQVDFEAMWYTDKDHGLTGRAYQHVYTHMTHFLQRCFV